MVATWPTWFTRSIRICCLVIIKYFYLPFFLYFSYCFFFYTGNMMRNDVLYHLSGHNIFDDNFYTYSWAHFPSIHSFFFLFVLFPNALVMTRSCTTILDKDAVNLSTDTNLKCVLSLSFPHFCIFLTKWMPEWWYIHAPRLGNCAENIEILSDWSLWLVLVCDVFKAFLFVSFSSSFWRKVCDYDELSCTTLSLRKRGCA